MPKRIETYITHKCNNNCVFCIEKENKAKYQNVKVFNNRDEIKTKFAEFKKQGYEHINLLGGEPFIDDKLVDALEIAKEFDFKVGLATNGSMLSSEDLAIKTLPLIDDLVLSVHGHNHDVINEISQNKTLFENIIKAFGNINKYFKGRMFKINCVVTTMNYESLLAILQFVNDLGAKQINFTNMEITSENGKYAVEMSKIKDQIKSLVDYAQENNMIIRFSEFPLCMLGENYQYADNLYFQDREKIKCDGQKDAQYYRKKMKNSQCENCRLNELCSGLDQGYFDLFNDEELKAFK